MSVRFRLVLLSLIGISGVLVAYGSSIVSSGYIEKAFELEALALESKVAMLQARRSEKDFFTRKKEEYVDKVRGQVDANREFLTQVGERSSELSSEAASASRLLDEYKSVFMEVAGELSILGLNEDQGLEGELRDAVHKVEEIVKTQKDDALMAAMLMLRRREKDFMLRGDMKYLDKLQKDATTMGGLVQKSEKLTAHDREKVETLLSNYVGTFERYVASRMKAEEKKKTFTETAHELEDLLDAVAEKSQARSKSLRQKVALLEMTGGATTVAILIVVGFLVLRSILRPLGALQRCSREVAGGDDDACNRVRFTAEFESFRQDLAAMVAHLEKSRGEAEREREEAQDQANRANDAMEKAEEQGRKSARARDSVLRAAGELRQVAEVVSSASEELSAQIEQSSQGAESQSRRVGETAAAMQEMNAASMEVVRSAARAAESADAANSKARDGAQIVSRVISRITEIQAHSQSVKGDMSALGEKAEGIGRVMNVINDIADQTNLLALNAAIEAARAGEAGRGFAVVADEVRKLAEKTMTATKEVDEAIRGIQEGARKNIDNVETTVGIIEETALLASGSGDALTEIVSLVGNASDQVRSIATASEQQFAASEEVAKSVEEINAVSVETSQAMIEAARAVGDLAEQAHGLRALTERMTVGEGHSSSRS